MSGLEVARRGRVGSSLQRGSSGAVRFRRTRGGNGGERDGRNAIARTLWLRYGGGRRGKCRKRHQAADAAAAIEAPAAIAVPLERVRLPGRVVVADGDRWIESFFGRRARDADTGDKA